MRDCHLVTSDSRFNSNAPEDREVVVLEFATPFATAFDPSVVDKPSQGLAFAKGIALHGDIDGVGNIVDSGFAVDLTGRIHAQIEPKIVVDAVLREADMPLLRLDVAFGLRPAFEKLQIGPIGFVDGRPDFGRS